VKLKRDVKQLRKVRPYKAKKIIIRDEDGDEIEMDYLYKVDEVSLLFRVSKRTVYNWIKQGKMTVIRLGNEFRIPSSEVERILNEGIK